MNFRCFFFFGSTQTLSHSVSFSFSVTPSGLVFSSFTMYLARFFPFLAFSILFYSISCITLFLAFALAHNCRACRSAALMKTLKRFVFSIRCIFYFRCCVSLALVFDGLVKKYSSQKRCSNQTKWSK